MTLPDRRLLLLGDWHWLVRDPLDVLRIAFFGGTVAFAAMGRSTAAGLTAASLLLLLARIINIPRRFDLGLIGAMTLISWGTALSLYGRYDVYDTIVHGLAPAFYAPVLYVCLVRLGVLSDPEETTAVRQHVGVFVSTLAIGMAVSAGWEVIEWLSDTLVGTAFVESADDTGLDLLAGTLGSAVGGAFLAVWSVSSWTTRRVTYRAVQAPDVRRWTSTLARRSRARVERAGAAALATAGVAALAFGVMVLVWPRPAVRTFAVLFGVYAVGHGVLRIVATVRHRRAVTWISLADSVVALAAGVALLVWPHISAAVLFFLMASMMVAGGLAGAALASVLRLSVRDRTLLGIAAGASVVLGVVVFAWPGEAINVLRWLVGAQALIIGPVLLVAAVRERRAHADADGTDARDEALPPGRAPGPRGRTPAIGGPTDRRG